MLSPRGTRKLLAITISDELDITAAASQGVTNPATASGSMTNCSRRENEVLPHHRPRLPRRKQPCARAQPPRNTTSATVWLISAAVAGDSETLAAASDGPSFSPSPTISTLRPRAASPPPAPPSAPAIGPRATADAEVRGDATHRGGVIARGKPHLQPQGAQAGRSAPRRRATARQMKSRSCMARPDNQSSGPSARCRRHRRQKARLPSRTASRPTATPAPGFRCTPRPPPPARPPPAASAPADAGSLPRARRRRASRPV